MDPRQQNLFQQLNADTDQEKDAPLAYRMRPKTLADYVGQEDLVAPGALIHSMIQEDTIVSMIFWGPPGCGKTSLARIIAESTSSIFIFFSAVISGIKEIKQVIADARTEKSISAKKTILFVDELHRFNKIQQDAFLPHIEDGTITLIGATTENPSFEVNSPLLSRLKVFLFKPLSPENIIEICRRSLSVEEGLARFKVEIDDDVLSKICAAVDGDVRQAMNTLELAAIATKPGKDGSRKVTVKIIEDIQQRRILRYDKAAEEHFNLISAFHKSLRGSDPDAALYWMMRMINGGEDPFYIIRRMIRFASEDIGLADPQALAVTIAARDTYHFLGSPEGILALCQAAVYLALAPRSNALYISQKKVDECIKQTGSLPVPLHIRNAPTQLMKDLGYGKDYQYAHEFDDAVDTQEYLPDKISTMRFYQPTGRGFEKKLQETLDFIEQTKKKKSGKSDS